MVEWHDRGKSCSSHGNQEKRRGKKEKRDGGRRERKTEVGWGQDRPFPPVTFLQLDPTSYSFHHTPVMPSNYESIKL
jgi:hypothetical protein